jgi:hypothetical protein
MCRRQSHGDGGCIRGNTTVDEKAETASEKGVGSKGSVGILRILLDCVELQAKLFGIVAHHDLERESLVVQKYEIEKLQDTEGQPGTNALLP